MITHNQLYAEVCSFENLLAAAHRAEHGKRMQARRMRDIRIEPMFGNVYCHWPVSVKAAQK